MVGSTAVIGSPDGALSCAQAKCSKLVSSVRAAMVCACMMIDAPGRRIDQASPPRRDPRPRADATQNQESGLIRPVHCSPNTRSVGVHAGVGKERRLLECANTVARWSHSDSSGRESRRRPNRSQRPGKDRRPELRRHSPERGCPPMGRSASLLRLGSDWHRTLSS